MNVYVRFYASCIMVALAFTPLAHAQAVCGKREDITKKLTDSFGETQTAVGMIGNDALMELWSSPEGTWTVLQTNEQGVTCMVGAGENFRLNPSVPKVGKSA